VASRCAVDPASGKAHKVIFWKNLFIRSPRQRARNDSSKGGEHAEFSAAVTLTGRLNVICHWQIYEKINLQKSEKMVCAAKQNFNKILT